MSIDPLEVPGQPLRVQTAKNPITDRVLPSRTPVSTSWRASPTAGTYTGWWAD